jgi:hypothetical protein
MASLPFLTRVWRHPLPPNAREQYFRPAPNVKINAQNPGRAASPPINSIDTTHCANDTCAKQVGKADPIRLARRMIFTD